MLKNSLKLEIMDIFSYKNISWVEKWCLATYGGLPPKKFHQKMLKNLSPVVSAHWKLNFLTYSWSHWSNGGNTWSTKLTNIGTNLSKSQAMMWLFQNWIRESNMLVLYTINKTETKMLPIMCTGKPSGCHDQHFKTRINLIFFATYL